jgi:hypothetical protein
MNKKFSRILALALLATCLFYQPHDYRPAGEKAFSASQLTSTVTDTLSNGPVILRSIHCYKTLRFQGQFAVHYRRHLTRQPTRKSLSLPHRFFGNRTFSRTSATRPQKRSRLQ